MGHPFGDLISQHLHRKHGLSQSKLAAGILQAPTVITGMCKGRRLTGPQARERVLAIIQWLHSQAALITCQEANDLLTAAGMSPLTLHSPAEAFLIQQLQRPETQPPLLPADSPHAGPRHNLPVQSTSFVGREAEQAQLAALLADTQCRLLTLVGPGGIGKTRLALQAVANQLDGYEHGIWFVALAPLSDANLVAATCLEALNLGQQPHLTPDEQLLHYLRRRQLLLVLDNFEHLPAAVGLVKAILRTAPRVKLLVTSRERLKVQEEWLLTVNGLATPPNAADVLRKPHLTEMGHWSAIQLFVERARRLQAAFALTATNAGEIAQICRSVDGIPLGIELAAGWARLLPTAAIAQAVAQDFTFLSSAWQDLPERHQSLAAVFGHSWRLLTAAEQAALRQLVVFRGGFLADAAQTVAGASLALLAGLVDKSWLRVSDSGRFDLHELIRQFIVRQNAPLTNSDQPIAANSSQIEALACHSRYYGAFLQSHEPFLSGPRQRVMLDELLAEVGNIRQGWGWAVEQLEVETMSQYLKSWQWLGEVRCWYREMAQMFGRTADLLKVQLSCLSDQTNKTTAEQIKLTLARTLYCQARHLYGLDAPAEVETLCQESLSYWPREGVARQYSIEQVHLKILLSDALYDQGRYAESVAIARSAWQESVNNSDPICLQAACSTLGFNAYTQGRFAEAQQWIEQSLTIANKSGEQVRKLLALMLLAELVCNQGDYERSDRYSSEVYQIAEIFGSTSFMACSYIHLGYAAFLTRQLEQAEQYFQNGLKLGEEINADFLRLNSRRWLGNTAYQQHNCTLAHQFFNEALVIARSINRQTDVAIALTGLGKVACAQGAMSVALESFHQALHILQATGAIPDLLDTLVNVSQLRLAEGANEIAAKLLGFVRHHPSLFPLGQRCAAQVYTALQSQLAEECLVATLAAGAAMTLDEVVAYALSPNLPEG